MRKLRTLLSALVLTLVSIFVTACSCGGEGGGGGLNVNHIYAESISLKCLTDNGSVVGQVDPVSKDLYITCHVGDRFVIEYEITPSTATTTQVDWSFDSAGVGIVEPYKAEGYTRNKSTKEQVEFQAKARSDSKYKTTLTFTIHDLSKSANAYIEVYDAVEDLSSFVTPENINFDTRTNSLTWSAVTKVKEPDGDVVNAKVSAGYPVGLTGYEIVRLDATTGEQIGEPIMVGRSVTKYEGLEAGVDYSFKVRALADGLNAKSSEFSNPFKFYKLATASDVSNAVDAKNGGTGEISFAAPLRSAKSVLYYFGMDTAGSYEPFQKWTEVSTTERKSYSVNHNDFVDKSNSSTYKIQIVSFPENYIDANGYALVGEEGNQVRYYPSDATNTFTVEKLVSPDVELATTTGVVTIDGVDFAGSNLSSYISLGVAKDYTSNFEQKYYYKLFIEGAMQEPVKEGIAVDGKVSLEGRASKSYVLEVTTIGNANTIYSGTTTFRFNVLSHLTRDNISLYDDKIEHDTEFATGGIELYFVSTNASKKQEYSVRKVIDIDNETEFDVQAIGLNAGGYDVYAKSMSFVFDDEANSLSYRNASVLPSTFTKLFTIEVAPMVTSNKITKEGTILFSKLTAYDNYKVIVNRKLKTATEYNEEQVVEIYAPTPENIAQGLLTYEYSETPYDADGHTARISIESIVESYLNAVYPGISILEFFSSDYQFIYSIVTVGNGSNIISSSPTTTFDILRYNAVTTIELNDYKLIFDKVGSSNRQQYTVFLNTYDKDSGVLKNSYEFRNFIGAINAQDKVELDLNTLIIKGGTTKFVELIDLTATNEVSIAALGTDGMVNSPATLSSVPTSKTFAVTTTPNNLTMTDTGVVHWETSVPVDDVNKYNYTMFFYLATTDGTDTTYTLLSDYTVKGITATFDELEGGERVAVLSWSVGDVLADYEDQVIAITVKENKFDMFSGEESNYLFATRISSPVLTRKHESSVDKITWAAINNADVYDIAVTELNDPDFTYTSEGSGNTYFSITDRLTDSTTPWQEGVYTISVSARSNAITNPADNAIDNPFVIASVASTAEVRIVNSRLEVTVNGDTLTWGNVCEGTDKKANYSLSYELADGSTETIDMGITQTYDASGFVAGTNFVTITPTIDFETSAFIIIGTPHKNAVDKWATATGLVSEKGNLVVYIDGATTAEGTVVELYQTVSGVDTVVATNLYHYDAPTDATNNGVVDGTFLKYTIILDGMDAGELTFKVKVKSTGMLDSDLSASYTGTKIAAVADFNKVGDYLTWSAQPGISSYMIGYINEGNAEINYLELEVEEDTTTGNYTAFVTKVNGDGDEYTETDETIFQYDAATKTFLYLFDEELFVGEQTGDILFNIRPLTEEAGYFSGNTSSTITITKLNNAVTATADNGVILIDKYVADGSATPTTYTLSIYKFTTNEESGEIVRDAVATYTTSAAYSATDGISPIDLNAIGLEENGNYEIELQFFGNGNEVLDSAVISNVTFDKLETTALMTKDGVLSWNEVDGAENYTIQISDGTNQYEFTVTGGMLREEDLLPPAPEPEPDPENPAVPEEPIEPDPEGGEDSVVEALSAGTDFSFKPGVWYTVKIKANASGKLHSKWSLPFSVKKLYAPTDIETKASVGSFDITVEVETETADGTITTTENRTVSVGTPIITWKDKNSSSLRFDYYLEYSSEYSCEIPYNTYLSYILATDLPVETYGIKMKVYGNTSAGTANSGYLTSDYSIVYNLRYIEEVANPTVTSGIVSWTAVDSAFAYKVTAYKTTEYLAYKEGLVAEIPTPVFTTTTASTTLNFANIILAENVSTSGSYTFVINALTRPDDLMVTTAGEKTNTVNIYKPAVFTDYKVKNGRLYWRVSVEDVVEFALSQTTAEGTSFAIQDESVDLTNPDKVAQAVLSYMMRKINMKVGDNPELEEQIKHLITVRLEVNGVVITDTPTEAYIMDSSDNQIIVESGYTSGKYIEYYYDVSIQPEVNTEDTEDPVEPDPEDPENGGDVEPLSARSINAAGVEYTAGKYKIRISAIGNTSSGTPVVNGAYTTFIEAYKPNTPKTWKTNGADIYEGKVQWELSTTEKSTIDVFDYYQNYRIRAYGVTDASSSKVVSVSVDDTYDETSGTNPNLTDNYLYYRDLKEEGDNNGLFSITRGAVNQILQDSFYKLYISTEGTADSTLLGAGDTIYLNSNECVVNRPVNILAGTKEFTIENSYMFWQTSFGSTATRLFIYGPFDCWDATGTKVNNSWVSQKTSDIILSQIDAVYAGDYSGLTQEEIELYKDKLDIVTLAESEGIRPTSYTLSDMFDMNGNSMYAPGGYIIRTQELGDDMGVTDSEISNKFSAIKLGVAAVKDNLNDDTDIMQTGGWVGLTDSTIWVWDNSLKAYKEKSYAADAPNEKVGVFVWNPVAGANSYEVQVYFVAPGAEYGEWLYTDRVRETCYDLPQGEQFNNAGKYFLRITAINTSYFEIYEMSKNYFSANCVVSTEHERVKVPEALTIFGSGEIQWNYGYTINNVGSYRVQFNYGTDGLATEIIAESGTDSVVPVLDMGVGNQNGTVEISIKAVAVSGNGMLNSGYCTSVKVTRLADPDMRLVNGVLYWGNVNGSDPLTSTEFTTDGDKEIISTPEGESTYSTNMQYFTDIVEHNNAYRAAYDEILFTPEEHTFTAMFQGSGGNEGSTMDSGEEFYISSNTIALTATKLPAPVINNVRLSIESVSENMVKWNLDSNAKGYRIRVFSNVQHPTGLPYYELMVSAETLTDLLASGATNDPNFVVQTEGPDTVVYFKLKPVIQEFELSSNNGGEIYIYVQALGSGLTIEESATDKSERPGGDPLFLASSYSTPTSIGVPPDPKNLEFNDNTGVLSWEINSETAYNIKINSTYKVTNVSEEEIEYWKDTADKFEFIDQSILGEPKQYSAYPEIVNRYVTIKIQSADPNDASKTVYTIQVVDTIVLTEKDNNGKTPLSYQVTSIGIDYRLTVTAMSFIDDEPTFASGAVSLSGAAPTFQTFDGGDGTKGNPYRISNLAQLQTIKEFTSSAFELTQSINFVDDKSAQTYWRAIKEFNGSIDGNGFKLENFAVTSTLGSNGITDILALFETNNGTIKNLNIEVSNKKIAYAGTTDGVNAATVAINNKGTIDNVHTVGTIEILPTGASGYNINTNVGGIVVNNGKAATINNSSSTMIVTALDDMEEFVSVGGIAAVNYGTITNSYFDGQVTGNRVGGITAVNMGKIDRCFVTETSIITVSNKTNSGTGLKGALAGGIAAAVTYNTNLGLDAVSITNSYSLATIAVIKGGDANNVGYTVGGLVGTMSKNSGISITNCYTVVKIKKVEVVGTNTINVYHMIGATGDVVMTNNYYIVDTCELTVSASSVNTVAVCEMVDTVENLKTKLSTLKDADDNQVYVVTETSYPTLKEY